jgi:hypothetical protein
MNAEEWTQMLQYSFQTMWVEVSARMPGIIAALVILLVGYLIAVGIKGLIVRLAQKLQIDQTIKSTGAADIVERSGYTLNIGEFIGTLVKWFVVAVFFIVALDVLNLNQVTAFLTEVVIGYLPRVIVATIILFAAVVIAQVVERFILASAKIAQFTSPALLAKFSKFAVIFFAVLAALNELQIATELVQMLFAGLVFALSLALGLSFGLGGKDAASRYIDAKTRPRV